MTIRLTLAAATLVAAAAPAGAVPRVVVDIAPAHAIVARVMAGVGTPTLLLPPGASPHGYAMRPSEARALQEADLVFWIGPALTPWLDGPVTALAGDAEAVRLLDTPGLTLLKARSGGSFEGHADHGHTAESHEDGDQGVAHEDEEEHAHGTGHDHAEQTGHNHIDPHVWLDPANAAVMARAAAGNLAEADPEHAATYRENAEAFAAELAALVQEIDAHLAPVRDRPFVVFHDAYRYFERRFDIFAAGSIALSDADRPSAARVAEIRARIQDAGVACVFAEPQFQPALVATVTEGTPARAGTLDPLGADLGPGPSLYSELLRTFAADLADCLTPGS